MTSNFGHFAIALICPPLYFFSRGRWMVGIVHSFIYLFALATLLVFGIGMFFWAIGAIHATWDLRAHLQEDAIQRQAEVLADKLGRTSSS